MNRSSPGAQSDSLPSDIEPPLLSQNLASDGQLSIAEYLGDRGRLARARKRAASADRLFRAGIIAKVEAEQRVLRIVQLEAMLAGRSWKTRKAAAAETETSEIAGIAEAARIATER